MRWVAAIVRDRDALLMVRQRGPDDPEDVWYVPGGVVEDGESDAEALARELREETGLTLVGDVRLAYHGTGGAAYEITAWNGEITCADPSGLVLEACFVPIKDALARIRQVRHDLMRTELLRYLEGSRGGTS